MINVKPEGAEEFLAGGNATQQSKHETESASLQNLFSNTVQLASSYNLTSGFYNLDNPVTHLTDELKAKLSSFDVTQDRGIFTKQELHCLIDIHKSICSATQGFTQSQGQRVTPVDVIETYIKSFISQNEAPQRAAHLVKNIHRVLFAHNSPSVDSKASDMTSDDSQGVEDAEVYIEDMSFSTEPGSDSLDYDNSALEQHLKRAAIETYRALQHWEQEKEQSRNKQNDNMMHKMQKKSGSKKVISDDG